MTSGEREGTVDYYPPSALCFPRERVRLSDFRLTWWLETYSPFPAGHVARGDFSTSLRRGRNDRRGASISCRLSAFRGGGRLQTSDWKRRFEERGLRFESSVCRLADIETSDVRPALCLEHYSLTYGKPHGAGRFLHFASLRSKWQERGGRLEEGIWGRL